MTQTIDQLLSGIQLIPVTVIDDEHLAVPLANALRDAGIRTIEVTLRTQSALSAIERIAALVPDIVVGAGSVIETQQAYAAADAGAQYIVSPGHTNELLDTTVLPYLPGATTASEVMHLRSRGYLFQKFFPAEAMGGLDTLKAIHAPIPDVRFCPTGGINASLAPEYIAQDCVFAIGGSWFIDAQSLRIGDLTKVTSTAKSALELVSHA